MYAVSYGFSGEELVEFLVEELTVNPLKFLIKNSDFNNSSFNKSSSNESSQPSFTNQISELSKEFTSQLLASYLAFLRVHSPEKLISAMVKLEYFDLLPGITNLLGATAKEAIHRIREQLKPILVAAQDLQSNTANTNNSADSKVSIDLSN